MVRLVQLEGEHNCINHATGGDEFDLSVEELRFLCQEYYDEYDAVRIILPDNKEKAFSYTTPSVIHHNSPPPPRRRKWVLGRIVKEFVLSPSYATEDRGDHHDDVIVIDDDDDEDDNEVVPYHDEEYIVEDDGVETSVVASSVGSNDYVPDVNMVVDDDDAVESKYVFMEI